MATCKQIQEYVREKYGYLPKTCWIAHMKEVYGLTSKVVFNRYSLSIRAHPCPGGKQNDVKDAFLHFQMI